MNTRRNKVKRRFTKQDLIILICFFAMGLCNACASTKGAKQMTYKQVSEVTTESLDDGYEPLPEEVEVTEAELKDVENYTEDEYTGPGSEAWQK